MTVSISGSQITYNDSTTQNTSPFTGGLAFRNRIINGDFRIDQRNAGASVTPLTSGDWYGTDRWRYYIDQSSKFSSQQSSVAPSGFVNSILVTSLSSYSVASGESFILAQNIEGLNTGDLAWGTASASSVTLSFWVRSSLTGTFGGSVTNSAINRSYPFSYTISAANTWEQKTVTIAGDTTGTWLTTNGIGLRVFFSLGTGSTKSGTAGAWAGADYRSATGATSVVGTNGATFYITGVQLEKGSTATSFDYRPYGTELALCQRYYLATEITVSNILYSCQLRPDGYRLVRYHYPVEMRTAATATITWNGDGSGISYGSVLQTKQFFQCLSASAIATSTVVPYLTAFSASAEL